MPALYPRRAREDRGPDRAHALEIYRRLAPTYDRRLKALAALQEAYRRRAVAHLSLRPGDLVVDVGCGTGRSLSLLVDAVGERGQVVGVEQSPEMLAVARRRVATAGWANVELLEAPAEEVEIRRPPAAAFFFFTHDVLRSQAAVANVSRQLEPSALVVASGIKLAPWWLAPVNVAMWAVGRRYVTTYEGMNAPWDHLAALTRTFTAEPSGLGAVYIGWGRLA